MKIINGYRVYKASRFIYRGQYVAVNSYGTVVGHEILLRSLMDKIKTLRFGGFVK